LPATTLRRRWRWFERADKQPFFFAWIWRPWTGDEKAMPVMLMTPDDVEQWLRGTSVEDALKMQKPAPDDAIVIRPEEKKAA
jgi:putative SOS response-associated peptidase YedK